MSWLEAYAGAVRLFRMSGYGLSAMNASDDEFPVQTRSGPGLDEPMQLLSSNLSRVEEAVEMLTKHLQPVLRPDEPHPTRAEQAASPASSPLGQMLFEAVGRLERLGERLHFLDNRVEL